MSSLVLLMEEVPQAAQILDLRPRHRRVGIITRYDKFSELTRNIADSFHNIYDVDPKLDNLIWWPVIK